MRIKFSIIVALLSIVLFIIACSSQQTEQRSQRFYAEQLCASALSSANADTLFLRASNNFALTSNDPFLVSALMHECNIRNVTAETSSFVRQLFTLNEMPTDNAMCAWDDAGIANINFNQIDCVKGNLKPAEGIYLRLICGVLLCNKYLQLYSRESSERQAEIRFLRALNYYYLLDIFGKAPIFKSFTEDLVDVAPSAEIYNFIECEVNEILPFLKDGKSVTDFDEEHYGHANKTAAHLLLARLYLNADVYIGTPQLEKTISEAKEVIDGPYKLSTSDLHNSHSNVDWNGYQLLFTADNGNNGSSCEMIFPIVFDSKKMADWNGSTYLVCSTTKYDAKFLPHINGFGMKEQWIGNRARANLVVKFLPDSIPLEVYHPTMIEWAHDDRALFQSVDRRLSCRRRPVFEDGFSVAKFNNLYSASTKEVENALTSSADFPLMRLAEAYLTLAEAEWRSGNTAEALRNINVLRSRAHAKPMESIDPKGYAILDEWAREFYFEGRRRTDLIRFGCFGGENDYLWQWKGGTILGRNFSESLNFYSLPADSLIAPAVNSEVDMYYVIGNGIGDSSWSTEGGDNLGKGLAPMCILDDNTLQFSDYMVKNVGFKMLRDFDSWDEQFGAGEYPGDVAHNQGGSKHFTVPKEGYYRVTLMPEQASVSITPIDPQTISNNESLYLWVNHGKTQMVKYSTLNKNTHVWRADFESEGGDLVIKVTTSPVSARESVNLASSIRYGISSSVDARGRVVLHTEPTQQNIRVIYNDIDNSLYSFVLKDEDNLEEEVPDDIKLKLIVDRENKASNNSYALKYSFQTPPQTVVSGVRLGLTTANSNDFGKEICVIKDGIANHEGTTLLPIDAVHKAADELPDSPIYRFSIEVDFDLYGDSWKAKTYSSTFYL